MHVWFGRNSNKCNPQHVYHYSLPHMGPQLLVEPAMTWLVSYVRQNATPPVPVEILANLPLLHSSSLVNSSATLLAARFAEITKLMPAYTK